MVPELGREDMRELIVGAYHIVYRVEGEITSLLTIYRASRLFPGDLFEE
jgi:hypothetical protein